MTNSMGLLSRLRQAWERIARGAPCPSMLSESDLSVVHPGDTVILRPRHALAANAQKQLYDSLAKLHAERGVKFVVLSDDDFEAHVLRATGAPE